MGLRFSISILGIFSNVFSSSVEIGALDTYSVLVCDGGEGRICVCMSGVCHWADIL